MGVEEATVLSNHENRLRLILDNYKNWFKAEHDTDAMVVLMSDVFMRLDALDIGEQDIIDQADAESLALYEALNAFYGKKGQFAAAIDNDHVQLDLKQSQVGDACSQREDAGQAGKADASKEASQEEEKEF